MPSKGRETNRETTSRAGVRGTGGGCGLRSGGSGRAPRAALQGLPPASFAVGDHGQDDRPPHRQGSARVCRPVSGRWVWQPSARHAQYTPGLGARAARRWALSGRPRPHGQRPQTADADRHRPGGCTRRVPPHCPGRWRPDAPSTGVLEPARLARFPQPASSRASSRCRVLAAAVVCRARWRAAAGSPYAAQGRRSANSPCSMGRTRRRATAVVRYGRAASSRVWSREATSVESTRVGRPAPDGPRRRPARARPR